MKLVLTHSSALDLTRSYRCGAPFDLFRTRSTSIADCAHTRAQIAQFEIPVFPRVDERLHVLVPQASMLCRSKIHASHLTTQKLPQGALVQVSDKVFAVSPSFVFVQYSARATRLQSALLGLELCGKYSLAPGNEPGMSKCAPIVTADELAKLLDKMPDARGAKAAREALAWVADHAASPMESAIFLLLTLPVRNGGYGLPRPHMNPPTSLSAKGVLAMGVDDLHCDYHWREAHIALEYNSKDSHVGHLTHDARRANALTSEGERVFTMTPAILANPEQCDILVSQIANALGLRLRGNALGTSPKRMALRRELFPWI